MVEDDKPWQRRVSALAQELNRFLPLDGNEFASIAGARGAAPPDPRAQPSLVLVRATALAKGVTPRPSLCLAKTSTRR
jgi:hypothetical protein